MLEHATWQWCKLLLNKDIPVNPLRTGWKQRNGWFKAQIMWSEMWKRNRSSTTLPHMNRRVVSDAKTFFSTTITIVKKGYLLFKLLHQMYFENGSMLLFPVITSFFISIVVKRYLYSYVCQTCFETLWRILNGLNGLVAPTCRYIWDNFKKLLTTSNMSTSKKKNLLFCCY